MRVKDTLLFGMAITGLLLTGCNIDKAHKHTGTDASEHAEVISVDQQEEITGTFGAEITTEGAILATQVLAELGDQESVELKVKGTIVEVCQMKGCWMTMDIGSGETMRVTFKDYEFFVPKPAGGYNAVIEGVASIEMVDVKTLQHYAEEAGKSEEEIAAITDPEETLKFEAVGVVITGTSD